MATPSNEWCQCPICLENYSLAHRPTTLICGHSVCIDHVHGTDTLEKCPLCQHSLKSAAEYHVSYSLTEAVLLFKALKTSIDWNTIVRKEEKGKIVETKSKRTNNPDSFYEEELRRKELLLDDIYSASNGYLLKVPQTKICGHKCRFTSTDMCCICLNRRPNSLRNTKQIIHTKDRKSSAKSDNKYCPVCKKHS